jgi:soluble lytic murein transglycosylase-like protein
MDRMALLELTFCALVVGGIGRAGQPERASAIRWADYYAAMYHVPPELVHAIIEVESGWHARAVSDKGAAGLMQLMPATAVRFGVTNRFDMAQNIQGGVASLARLTRVFNGDLRLVTAAYVSGENRILPAGLMYSNAEVFAYVSKVARLYAKRQHQRVQSGIATRTALEGGSSP